MSDSPIIFKTQKDLYHVLYKDKKYLCTARGVMRERSIKPLVGDFVDLTILSDEKGLIEAVVDRKNSLIRPPVANVDQIVLVLTLKSPNLNYMLADKYLLMLEHYGLDVVLVFNKVDLIRDEEKEDLLSIYGKTGHKIIFTSTLTDEGIDDIRDLLANKISALAGPSGVGKSSILNMISKEEISVETGSISKKTKRGRHTTRHTELFEIFDQAFILDTPGFSSLDLSFIEDADEVKNYYPEFVTYSDGCKFQDCQHINEPICGVKNALEAGKLSKKRYDNYLLIREEIFKNRRY